MESNHHEQRKKPLIYCPECYEPFMGMGNLIQHVKERSCAMTQERLLAVGVLDEHELEEYDDK